MNYRVKPLRWSGMAHAMQTAASGAVFVGSVWISSGGRWRWRVGERYGNCASRQLARRAVNASWTRQLVNAGLAV
jgi:hypothetical protein